MSEADLANRPELARIAVMKLARQWGPADWARGLAAFVTAGKSIPEAFAGIAEVAMRLSQRLGASPAVTAAMGHAYARWDGKVFADLPCGDGNFALRSEVRHSRLNCTGRNAWQDGTHA